MSQSFAQLEYDPDYYNVDVSTSVAPMKHVLDPTKYENEKRCTGFSPEINQNVVPGENKEGSGNLGRYSRVIDDESDLRLLQYKLSKNPSNRFMPSSKKNDLVNFGECPDELRFEVSRHTLPAIESKSANIERFIYEEPMRNFQIPLYRQGHVEMDRYNLGGGASSRLAAKDSYVRRTSRS